MLAIDTDIVIRFLTRDHRAQARRALEIVSNNDVFVPVTVVLEAEWVLRDAYELPRDAKRSSLWTRLWPERRGDCLKLGFGLPDAPRARSQWSAEPSGA